MSEKEQNEKKRRTPFSEWTKTVMSLFQIRNRSLKRSMTTKPSSVFKDPYFGEILTTIHDKCVVDLADKTHNNIVHI